MYVTTPQLVIAHALDLTVGHNTFAGRLRSAACTALSTARCLCSGYRGSFRDILLAVLAHRCSSSSVLVATPGSARHLSGRLALIEICRDAVTYALRAAKFVHTRWVPSRVRHGPCFLRVTS